MAGHTHFGESLEEYLEAVYRLEREGPGVTTSGLAADLGVAPASVSGMLKSSLKAVTLSIGPVARPSSPSAGWPSVFASCAAIGWPKCS